MKTVFDKETRDELISRINKLSDNSTARWGQMNAYQMIRHCTLWEKMVQDRKLYKRMFIGLIFGRMALKSITKDETPLGQNTPTIPDLKITGNGNVSDEKANWIARIREYANYTDQVFIHPFFGKMTKEQVGYLAYKHSDHHLRQFNS